MALPAASDLKRALELYITTRRVLCAAGPNTNSQRHARREHILQGLLKAIDLLDQVIATIRGAASAAAALEILQGKQPIPPVVVQRIVPQTCPYSTSAKSRREPSSTWQLRRLAALERQQLLDEYNEIIQRIAYLEDLLANPRKIDFLIRDDVQDSRRSTATVRRTEIVEADAEELP